MTVKVLVSRSPMGCSESRMNNDKNKEILKGAW